MKWIGALMIIGITTWIGFDKSHQLNRRPKHIRQLKNALQILEAEILYSQSSLQTAFQNIADQVPQPMSNFFQSLAHRMQSRDFDLMDCWEKSVQKLINQSSLGLNEAEILKQFGRTLGQHDMVQQQKHIQLTITHLERELEEARDEQYRFGKMSKSLGVLLGVFIVLLLI
ncbi:stage III sporulation protein SpoAB [Virgibacillus sp. MSJ-26]|uniref:stage III sporulation protein SpoIIIAB n=1 Tax=Virgibacillus sp. MSJ-26 TaxID=2841522 RepID=UPI001C10E8EC|nr:stage III sporulation protein SpoIIIAB [Virgibacillus sp. MSJ-26]MBU5466368.1 stage III sporulation protein SpoAB [Virgibacillus sp. MSJ-26]